MSSCYLVISSSCRLFFELFNYISYLTGERCFWWENTSNQVKTVRELIEETFGTIHDCETAFLLSQIHLNTSIRPGDKYYYKDYGIEEQFRQPWQGSLLEVFLRKHRKNKVTPLFRPVSFYNLKVAAEAEAESFDRLGLQDN